MSYINKALEYQLKAHKKQVAVKLLDGIDKILMDYTQLSSRRWIWELLQNAKDVSKGALNIEIELGQDYVEFRHNGLPFTMEDLTFLIEQISTKERRKIDDVEKPLTSGKFGTGFMTTHLLSKIVNVSGILYEADEKTYKPFNLKLDRDADTIECMIDKVETAFDVFQKLDTASIIESYQPHRKCDTVFRYILSKEGYQTAQKGIDDLRNSLPYTMVFIPEISKVSIEDKVNSKYEEYTRGKIFTVKDIIIDAIDYKSQNQITQIYIANNSNSNNSNTVAIELEKKGNLYSIKQIPANTPRLFCDFPLVGTETFPYPTIINSYLFNPTEPRNGIYLLEQEGDKIEKNKRLLEGSVLIYEKIINSLISDRKTKNLYWLAKTPLPKDNQTDLKWYHNNIQIPIRKILLDANIVETSKEHIKLKDALIPYHSKKECLVKLAEYSQPYFSNQLPYIDDFHLTVWRDNIADTNWEKDFNIRIRTDIENIIENIQDAQNIENLRDIVKMNEKKLYEWLNSVYEFINDYAPEEDYFENYSILPNQIGDLLTIDELYFDNNIPEPLKDAITLLGEPIREDLLDKKITTINFIEERKIDLKIVSERIDKTVERNENYRITNIFIKKLAELNCPEANILKLTNLKNHFYKEKASIIETLKENLPESFYEQHKFSLLRFALDPQMRQAVYIVTSLQDKKATKDAYIENYRDKIWKFVSDLDSSIPKISKLHIDTYIWTKTDERLLDIITFDIKEETRVSNLSEGLSINSGRKFTDAKTINWLNDFFKFLIDIKKSTIITDLAILPAQDDLLKKKKDLFIDNIIHKELKDTIENLEKILFPERKKHGWRHFLLNEKITAFDDIKPKEIKDISIAINELIDEDNEDIFDVMLKLIACIPSEKYEQNLKVYEYCKAIFGDKVPSKKTLKNITEFEWSKTINYLLTKIIEEISSYGNVDEFNNNYNFKDVFIWLNDFILFVNDFDEDLLDIEDMPIIPNYYGDFRIKDELYYNDKTLIPELIEVLETFNKKWIEEILDTNIKIPLPDNKRRSFKDLAKEIDQGFLNYDNEKHDKTHSSFVKSFRLLMDWIKQSGENEMKIHFPWTIENKAEISVAILGNDDEKDMIFGIIESGKIKVLHQITEKMQQQELEDFANDISTYRAWKRNTKKGEISVELAELFEEFGFESIDDLKEFLNAKRRNTPPERNPDLNAINESNKRAKRLVREKLQSDNRYDCTNWKEETRTIISGVIKNNEPISLIIKGADYGTVVFNDDEKDILKSPNSELWINTEDTPEQLTLGDVLEKYKIKYLKMRIKMEPTDINKL